jgi:xanthine dehydrogenase accessory factor
MLNIFQELSQIEAAGLPVVLVTVVETRGRTPGKVSFKMLVREDGSSLGTVGGGELEAEAIKHAGEVFRSAVSETIHYDLDQLQMGCGGNITLFYDYLPAERQLLIFGAGHVGRALYQIARIVGFKVSVFDNRNGLGSFFQREDFFHCELENLPFDRFPETSLYAAIMTYDHQHDYAVLRQLLASGCAFRYIGLIGSERKIRETTKRLKAAGLDLPQTFFAPIGVRIGAKTAAEIAVSILAEMIAVANQTPADSMRMANDL